MNAPRWRRYLRFVRPDVRADVDEELSFHIDSRIEQNIARGMSPDDARREALERFGAVDVVRDTLVAHDHRKEHAKQRAEFFVELWQDLRFGARALRRSPGFAIAAALTLALGIGANAAMFSVLNAVVLQPLPYKNPQRLVNIGTGSAGEFVALGERLKSMTLGAWMTATHPVDDGHEPLRLEGASLTANMLSMLGVTPALGRGFTETDAIPSNAAVVIISNDLWQRLFSSSRDVLGKRLMVEGVSFTIIGVMPESFHFPSKSAEYWQPMAFTPSNPGQNWAVMNKHFVGRLTDRVTLEQARREVHDTWPTLRHLNPLWDPGDSYRKQTSVVPLQQAIVGTSGSTVWMLFGSVVVVLLVACVNVANLLLARATTREREMAVRAALGGGRPRLVRQLITENVLLASVGGVLGIGLAYLAVHTMIGALPADLPRIETIAVNRTVLAFTAAIAVATGFAFGIVPALRATASHGASRLAAGVGARSTAGATHLRISDALMVSEVALAVVLGVASVLLMRSFVALRATDSGLRTTQVVAARVSVPYSTFKTNPTRVAAIYDEVLARTRGLPGVRNAAFVDKLPLRESVWGMAARVQGQFEDSHHALPSIGHFQLVSPGYFETMGIPLKSGRDFTALDREQQPPVAVISESVARQFWPKGDAIGQRIGYAYDSPWLTVIGVVPDTRQDSLRDTVPTSIYAPWAQRTLMTGSEMWIVARTSGSPAEAGQAIRAIVRNIDRTIPVSDVQTMDAVVSDSVRHTRFITVLVGAFAALALVLGTIGIYGVMSYLVSQRTREMGIRLALGATRTTVISLVVGRAAMLAGVGAVIGIGVSLWATRFMRRLLIDVTATDALTLGIVAALFLLVAALASYGPALRATRVDPAEVLKGA